MTLNRINTDRLVIIPITFEITSSLLTGSFKEIEKLGINTDGSWPTEDTMDILPIINKSLEVEKIPSGFETWMIVRKDNMKIIGDIGFYGKPNEKGEVEVGFGLVEHERGRGFGFETLIAIKNWLFNQENVKVVKARCLINNTASKRILEKADMIEIKRDMDLIYWQLVK
ncbi:GNAT family protein [Desulfotomaculum defluvii]